MSHLATRDCSCEMNLYAGQKRPEVCVHGNRFLTDAQLNPKPRKPIRRVSERREGEVRRQGSTLKRSQPTRDWTAAVLKVESEGKCRVCGSGSNVEAAHVMGRKHDEPVHPGSSVLYVDPNRIVPLCGPFPDGHHGEYDHKRLDLLSYLTLEEQVQAVADAGGIELARKRLCPSAYREEVAV